jgi:hypothetical protein
VLFSAIGSIGDRLDSKFITAYFFPAFVAVLGTIWIAVTAIGGDRFADRLAQFDSVEQAIMVLLLLLGASMLAHMLRAMARPIAQVYAGRSLPELLRKPSVVHQRRARARSSTGLLMASRGERLYPHDAAETAPTAFGNAIVAAADYPRLVYGMEAFYWWPRLLPLLPAEFQELLRSMETPMRAMLNLSLVSLYLGCLSAIVLGLAASQWMTTVVSLVIGLLLANFFYRAAIAQATELSRNIWVGFDLYRHEILKQMNLDVPATLPEERALWQQLTQRLRDLEAPLATADTAGAAASERTGADVTVAAHGSD